MFYILMYSDILNLRLIQILLQEQGHGHTIEQTHLHVLVINFEFGKLYNILKSCLH